MSERVTDEWIENAAELARLELTGQEMEQAKKDMEEMLSYIDQLKELDTEQAEPMTHVFPIYNAFREDIEGEEGDREAMRKNAPAVKEGAYQVPKTVE